MRSALIVPIALVLYPAHAGVVITEQFRVVTARVTLDSLTDQPDPIIGLPGQRFEAQIGAGVSADNGASSAAATQISDFLADRITAQGTASTSASSLTGAFFDTRATSVFDVTLVVDQATQIQIVSSRSGLGAVTFAEAGGPTLFSGSGVESLTLAAGVEYRLTASAGGSLDAPGSSGGAYSVQVLGVPTPSTLALLGIGAVAFKARRR
jgi:hypothetical protein